MPRPKGSQNKVTTETKQFLMGIVQGEHPRIQKALTEVYETDKDHYLSFIVKLLPFIVPKANEVHISSPALENKTPSWFDTVPES